VLDITSGPCATWQPNGQIGSRLRSSGIEVHEADEGSAPDWIEGWHPDVISAHGALPECVLATAHRASVPYVDTLHGMHDLFHADWQAEAARSAKLSVIVSVSELVRQQYLAGNHHFPAGRVVTIPNGVDDERRQGVTGSASPVNTSSYHSHGIACRRTPMVWWPHSVSWRGAAQRHTS
jgi:Glycosyltransferase Family 4